MKILYFMDAFPIVSQTFVWDRLLRIPKENLASVMSIKINKNDMLKELPDIIKKKLQPLPSSYPEKFEQFCIALRLKSKIINFLRILTTSPLNQKKFIWQAARLYIEIKKQNADIVHAEFARDAANICYFTNFIFGIPYTVTVHGFDLREPLGNIGRILGYASIIFCPSEFHKKRVEEIALVPLKKAIVIYLGIKITDFTMPNRRACKNMKMLCIARLHPVKNHKLLFDALAIIKDKIPNASLILAGGGELEYELKDLAEQLKISHLIDFIGEVSRDEVLVLLKKSDTFVLTSQAEGLSVAALEAAVAGLVVVATNVGGMSELIEHEKTGVLVNPDNSEELAEVLLTLYLSPQKRFLLGESATKYCTQNFNLQQSMNQQLAAWQVLSNRDRISNQHDK